jgi:hypothetical protein
VVSLAEDKFLFLETNRKDEGELVEYPLREMVFVTRIEKKRIDPGDNFGRNIFGTGKGNRVN